MDEGRDAGQFPRVSSVHMAQGESKLQLTEKKVTHQPKWFLIISLQPSNDPTISIYIYIYSFTFAKNLM